MTELAKLQGAWNVTSLEIEGQKMPAPNGARIVVEGSRFQSLGMGAVYEGTLELNPRKRPRHLDLVFTEGPEKGNRSLGIYQWQGEDWRLCLTLAGSARPTEFATTPGSGHALETLSRTADEPLETSALVSPSPSAPVPELDGEWQMIACSADGYPVPDAMVKTGRRVTRNGETAAWFGKDLILRAIFTADRDPDPHTIDYALRNGQRQYGIWKFEGDVLHVCFAAPGKPRPASFTPAKGQGHTFTSWMRK